MRAAAILVVAVVALAGAFLLFRPAPSPIADTDPAAPSTTGAASAPSKPQDVLVSVDLRKPLKPEVTRIAEGARVILRVTGDARDALHVHGYDLHLEVVPGKTAELRFVADRTGRFEYELHDRHASLGVLEVYPREN